MHRSSRAGRTQRGNILFLILLAVVLFAALNYAVTSSMRGGGKDASSENAEAAAAEILQWFAAVDNAVIRMRLNGIAYEDMSFVYDGKYFSGAPSLNKVNNARCSSDTCRIFKPDGGGVRPPDFSNHGNSYATGAQPTYQGLGDIVAAMYQWPGAGTHLNDVVIYLHYIQESVCAAIRKKIGQSITPATSGSYLVAENPSNWDNAGQTFSANYNELYARDTYVGATAYPGTRGAYCYVFHVVIKR